VKGINGRKRQHEREIGQGQGKNDSSQHQDGSFHGSIFFCYKYILNPNLSLFLLVTIKKCSLRDLGKDLLKLVNVKIFKRLDV
jgi:hypothetical protein